MSQPEPATTSGTYVYCVGYADPLRTGGETLSSPGVGGPDYPTRTIEYEDLAAVVSNAPATHFDISRDNLLAHEHVVEEAMQVSDVLPVAFGTVAVNDDEVREKLLARASDEFHQQLDYVHGCVELDLRVLWKREQLFAEIVAENDEIRELRDYLAEQDADSAYHERIRLGELTAAAIDLKRDQEAQAILDGLEPLAVETVVNQNLTDMMVVNAAFLVARDQIPAFDTAVQEISAPRSGRMIFQYVGPMPPYNFVNISVEWEE